MDVKVGRWYALQTPPDLRQQLRKENERLKEHGLPTHDTTVVTVYVWDVGATQVRFLRLPTPAILGPAVLAGYLPLTVFAQLAVCEVEATFASKLGVEKY